MAKALVSNSKPAPAAETKTNEDFASSVLLAADPQSEKERERGVWSSFGIWGFEFED